MAESAHRWTLGWLAESLGGTLAGPADLPISRPVPPDSDDPTGITFAENERYRAQAEASGVGAIIVPLSATPQGKPLILVPNPRAAFGAVLAMSARPLPHAQGVHPWAVVDPEANVDPSASVGPFAVVERQADIGPGVKVFPHCYVGENCRIGARSTLYPGVVLVQDVVVGEGVVLHSGTVLGADGFGFVWDGSKQAKIPQVGGVVLGDGVEVGANSTVDRATAGDTILADGVKIDNLVQVAHNVRIGEHTVVAALVGIGGSTTLGARNTIAGQAAFSDHVQTCDDVVLGGRSGVSGNIESPGAYLGYPARPYPEAIRNLAISAGLAKWADRIRALEARVKELEQEPE